MRTIVKVTDVRKYTPLYVPYCLQTKVSINTSLKLLTEEIILQSFQGIAVNHIGLSYEYVTIH